MPETPYTETEALLLAAVARDSGLAEDEDALDKYLADNFLPGELRSLARSADYLASHALAARMRKAGS